MRQQMHCLTNIDQVPARRSAASTQERRLAALRKAVEGLEAAKTGEGTAAHAAAVAAGQGLLGADWGLPAELPCGAVNEVVADHADRPAAFGFLFTLMIVGLDRGLELQAGPAMLVASRRALSDCGDPYGHGLAQLGLDVGRLILIETKTDKDALWALEETLRSGTRPALVAGALAGGLDLTSSRRLNLAAAPQRTPLAVLRGANATGTSAAAARWRISAAPAARDRFGALAAPRWHITLERSRLGSHRGGPMNRPMNQPGAWLIEWNHVTHRFRVVAGLADRPPVAGADLRRAG
jgi:protein ImuA